MTVSISKMKGIDYYLNLQREDYYTRGGEPPGFWLGAGAERLGLAGAVDRDVLHNLLNGYTPDGKQSLIQQQKYGGIHAGCGKARQHQLGWDITASAPKPYSVICGIGPDELRPDTQACGIEAAKAVIKCIEAEAAFSRRGQGGKRREKAELIFAVFPHTVSRAGDCQTHYHMICLNLAYRPSDSTFGTIESKPLYDYKMTLGAIFRGKLAQGLTRMGFEIERAEHGFTIRGISDEVCQHFSKRRQAIKERLDELGQHTAADAERVTLETRGSKKEIPPREQLVGRWRAEAAEFGLTPQAIADLIKPEVTLRRKAAPDVRQVVDEAIETVAIRQDTFTKKDVVRQALDSSVGSGVDVDETIKTTQKTLKDPEKAIPLPFGKQQKVKEQQRTKRPGAKQKKSRRQRPQPEQQPQEETIYTSRHALKRQRDITKRIERMRGEWLCLRPSRRMVERTNRRFSHTHNPIMEEIKFHAEQFIKAAKKQTTKRANRPLIREQANQTLDESGKLLVRRLTRFPGRATVISNSHVEKRTIALRAATQAWQKAGYKVVIASPYRRTAKALEDATRTESITFKKLQLMMHHTFSYHVRHFAEQHIRAAFNRRTFSLNDYRFDRKKVLIVDQADMLSLDELSQIVRDVKRQGGRLILLTPHLDDLLHPESNLTAQLLNELSNRWSSHLGANDYQPDPEPQPEQEQQRPGMGMSL